MRRRLSMLYVEMVCLKMEYRVACGFLLLMNLICGAHTLKSSVIDPPQNTAAEKGTDAQFFCKIEANDPTKEHTYWGRILTLTNEEKVIYQTNNPEDEEFDSTKYNFTETAPFQTNIVVKNVTWQDAGTYICAPLMFPYKKETAELVVVDKPSIIIPDSISHGEEATFSCDVLYALGTGLDTNGLKPTLTAKIGDLQLDLGIEKPDISIGLMNTMGFEYTLAVTPDYDGKDFTCVANIATSPPYEISSSQTIFLDSPVYDVKVDQERDLYYPGEQINCTAEGYPPPEFTWIPEISGFMDTINGSVLSITPEMTGENQWTCEALNVINGLEHAVSTNISFNVEDISTGESQSSDVVIVLGVLIPLILIILAVIVFIFFWRRKKHPQNPSKPSLEDPEKTVPKFQTEDPLIKKKPAPKDDMPEGLLLPKEGIPSDDDMSSPAKRASVLKMNANDHSLAFSGDEDNDMAARRAMTPSPVEEKPPFSPSSEPDEAVPITGQATVAHNDTAV